MNFGTDCDKRSRPETLNAAILLRLARCDRVPLDRPPVRARPGHRALKPCRRCPGSQRVARAWR